MAYNIKLTACHLRQGSPYYTITYRADLPPGLPVVLRVKGQPQLLARMKPSLSDLTAEELDEFFKLVGYAAHSGMASITCYLEAELFSGGDKVVSADFQLPLPVVPVSGPLNTQTLGPLAMPRLNYPGNGKGRLLTESLGGFRFFKYNGSLETNPAKRGLDCTTFPEVLFEVSPNLAGFYNGNTIAIAIGAQDVGLEAVSGATIKKWIAGLENGQRVGPPADGVYMIWGVTNTYTDGNGDGKNQEDELTGQSGHILIYKGEAHAGRYSIHQFNIASGGYPEGYSERCVKDQGFSFNSWWARKINRADYCSRIVNTAVGYWPYDPSEMQAQVGKPGGQLPRGTTSPGGGGGGAANGGQKYTVVAGDSLSLISKKFWGDLLLWPILYDANRQTVGSDPNRIEIGQRLSIPNIKSYSDAQLNDARNRGRNWR